jgi:hypothetical protein
MIFIFFHSMKHLKIYIMVVYYFFISINEEKMTDKIHLEIKKKEEVIEKLTDLLIKNNINFKEFIDLDTKVFIKEKFISIVDELKLQINDQIDDYRKSINQSMDEMLDNFCKVNENKIQQFLDDFKIQNFTKICVDYFNNIFLQVRKRFSYFYYKYRFIIILVFLLILIIIYNIYKYYILFVIFSFFIMIIILFFIYVYFFIQKHLSDVFKIISFLIMNIVINLIVFISFMIFLKYYSNLFLQFSCVVY